MRCSGHVPPEGCLGEGPRQAGRTVSLGLPANALGLPQKTYATWPWRGKPVSVCLGYWPHDLTLVYDGWMDLTFPIMMDGRAGR